MDQVGSKSTASTAPKFASMAINDRGFATTDPWGLNSLSQGADGTPSRRPYLRINMSDPKCEFCGHEEHDDTVIRASFEQDGQIPWPVCEDCRARLMDKSSRYMLISENRRCAEWVL